MQDRAPYHNAKGVMKSSLQSMSDVQETTRYESNSEYLERNEGLSENFLNTKQKLTL
jgi:hypothetical protein